MARPPVMPVEDRLRIVLSVLRGETTAAEAARWHQVSERRSGTGSSRFLRLAGSAWLRVVKPGPNGNVLCWTRSKT